MVFDFDLTPFSTPPIKRSADRQETITRGNNWRYLTAIFCENGGNNLAGEKIFHVALGSIEGF